MAKRVEEAKENNLVPIMNLVTILIPFLLMAISFVSLSVIDSTLPAIRPTGDPDPIDDAITLSVLITDEGFAIAGAEDVLGDPAYAIPAAAGQTWDTAELTRVLSLVKDEHPNHENVILVPEPHVPYEVLVRTMDAARLRPGAVSDAGFQELFPYVVIAGGAG